MIKGRILTKKILITFSIIGILIFSGILGAFFNQGLENYNDNDTELGEQAISPAIETTEESGTRADARAFKDVGVVSISDIDAENFIDHFPGKPVHMNVTVRNFGDGDITTPFEILMTVSDGSSRYPSYFYQENLTLPSALNRVVMTNRTQGYNLTWNWTPPLSMPHGAEFNLSQSDVTFKVCFTTLMEGDQNSVNNQNCIGVKVEKPDFDLFLEPGWWINNLYLPQDRFHVVPKKGQTNQFDLNFTLYNFGEATFINFTVNAPPDWKAIPPPRTFWQARSNSSAPPQNLSITVFPSIKLQYLPTATTLSIKLTAIAESFPLERHSLEGQEVYYISPGDAYIDFKVKNLGNGEDNFETWALVGEREVDRKRLLKDGWRAVVHSGKISRILKRGESQTISVKVTIPSRVRAGSPCGITLYAKSIKDDKHIDGQKNRTSYIFADEFKDVSFDAKKSNLKTISMFPNSEISRILTIRNTGNKQDDTISVNVTSLPDEWEVIIDSSDIPQNGLPRNGTAEIQIIIKTPRYVVESMYDVKLAAMSDYLARNEITLKVQILKVRNILLTSKNDRKRGNVSEKISFLVTIENNGNTKDSIDIRHSYITPGMKDMDWRVVMSKNFTTLYPYESRDVIVSVFIPLEALADTDFLTPTLDGYRILVRGISQNDSSVTATKEIEALVNPIYDFSFNKQKDRGYMISRNTEPTYYLFSISNKGNDRDTYDFTYETDPGNTWITVPFTQRKLLPGVTESLYIELEPPAHISIGEYVFTIRAVSDKDPSLSQEIEITIEIIEFDLSLTELKIGDESLKNADVKEGETVLLRAKLENIGALDYYNETIEKMVSEQKEIELKIKFQEGYNYIGDVEVFYLPSQKNSDNNTIWVGLPWKIGKARVYEISVEVDPDSLIPDSNSKNNKVKGTLTVTTTVQPDDKADEASAEDITMILVLIIIFVIIMLVGIWMTINISKRQQKMGYTVDGEYKPYEEMDKAEFDKDEDEEEEPEGGVLGISGAHPYGGKKKDKFMSDLSAMITMKPIKRTKPIRRSKPITTIAAGPKGLERPKIAGYLPPKSKSDTESTSTTDDKQEPSTKTSTASTADPETGPGSDSAAEKK
jgi:uncharacterized membrane protein